MLAVPFLLGVAASQPSPWQLVLAAAAVAGYLASATAQAWLRARRRASFVPSLTVYAVAFGVLGLALLAVFPIVLVPAAACVSGDAEAARVLQATLVAGAYLVGTVLVVRSVIRERGSSRFAAASAAYHLGLVVLAAAFLAEPYALVAAVLAVRAIGLPIVQRRRAGTAHPLRPVHVGIVEIVVSTILVAVAFAAPA
jgi:hypothetical protein